MSWAELCPRPPNSYIQVPVPQQAAVFGDKAFIEAIRVSQGESGPQDTDRRRLPASHGDRPPREPYLWTL